MQQNKGKAFERRVARDLRERWPAATVQRSRQAHMPYQSDVFIEGDAPEVLRALWLECEDAKHPDPKAKMRQAERDVAAYLSRRELSQLYRIPVVVWHKKNEQRVNATLHLSDLFFLLGEEYKKGDVDPLVQLDWEKFLSLLPTS